MLVQSAKKSFGAAGAYKSVHVSIFKYARGFPEGPPRFAITLDENVFADDVSLVTAARAPKEVLKLPFGITVDKAELGPGTNKQPANDDSGDYYLSDASGACKGGAVSDDPDGGDTSGDDEPIEHPIAPPADEPPPPPPIVPPVVPPVDVAIIAPPVAPAGPVRRALGLLSCSRAPPRSRAKCVLCGNRIMPAGLRWDVVRRSTSLEVEIHQACIVRPGFPTEWYQGSLARLPAMAAEDITIQSAIDEADRHICAKQAALSGDAAVASSSSVG